MTGALGALLGALLVVWPALAAPVPVLKPTTQAPPVFAPPTWRAPDGVALVTQPYVTDLTPTVTYVDPFKPAVFKGLQGDLPYRLLSPAAPPPAGQGYPLVVVLHSSGPPMGRDNLAQLSPFSTVWADPAMIQQLPAYVLLPQTAIRTINYEVGTDGQRASKPEPILDDILALIDSLVATRPIDRSRIYLNGFSMGAGTALQALLARPQMFAGVVAFSPIPPDRSLAAYVADTPMMLIHGDADTVTEIGPDLAWAGALVKAGGHPLMTVYRGMDHRLPPDMAQSVGWRTWLFQQRRADPSSASGLVVQPSGPRAPIGQPLPVVTPAATVIAPPGALPPPPASATEGIRRVNP
jgi:predicted esterase